MGDPKSWNGGTAERRDGGTAGRRDGGTAGRRDGGMAGWRDGGMAGWRKMTPNPKARKGTLSACFLINFFGEVLTLTSLAESFRFEDIHDKLSDVDDDTDAKQRDFIGVTMRN